MSETPAREVGPDRSSSRFRAYVIGAVVVFGGLSLGVPLLAEPEREILFLVGFVGCGTLTWLSSWHRWRHAEGRLAPAWLVLSFGAVFGVLANGIVLAIRVAGLAPELEVISEPFLVLALIACVLGLVLFSRTRRKQSLVRLGLDGLLAGGALMFVIAAVVFPELLRPTSGMAPAQRSQLFLLPVLDVAIATIAVLLVSRSGRQLRAPLTLLAVGFGGYTVADMMYAIARAGGEPALGDPSSLGWIAGYLLFALAARHPMAGRIPVGQDQRTSPVVLTSLLFVLYLGATVVLLVRASATPLTPLAAGVWLVLTLAASGRQILLVTDNEVLRRDLELKVRERTKELEASTYQRELLLDSVADGIYGVDDQGRVTFVNAAASTILRRTEAELIGEVAHDLFHVPASEDARFGDDDCFVEQAIADGRVTTARLDGYRDGTGLVVPVEVTVSPLRDEGGIRGAVVAFRDVTQRFEVDRMKGEFVSVVSHELRTPLTSIQGSLGLVAAGVFGELPPEAARMVQIAVRGSQRLTRLVNDILDLERIEGEVITEGLRCDVAEACDEAVATVAGLAAEAGVEIDLGPCSGVVAADHDRVVQTLVNLVGNAVKFSEPGHRVTVQAVADRTMVEFAVRDQGRGIPLAKQEDIFGRFTQVDSSDAREKGGSGLGLAISRSLVTRYGGRIWVESRPQQGATFRFTLPVAGDASGDAGGDASGDAELVTAASGPQAPVRVSGQRQDSAE